MKSKMLHGCTFVSYNLIDIQSTFCLTNNNTRCLLFFDSIPLLLLLLFVVVLNDITKRNFLNISILWHDIIKIMILLVNQVE